MTAGRRVLAGLLLVVTCTGCASARATPQVAAPVLTTAPSPTTSPPSAEGLLGSQPATLDVLRASQALRPVSVLVPGVARPAPVEARTTDPVSGGLDLPEGAAKVAWWASGAAPGAGAGSVVLAAHVSYDGQTGPFTRLSKVAPGSPVVVTSADGSTHRYTVQTTRSAAKTALDRGELFRTTGPATLVLVTCGGAYNRSTHSFAENIVVTATPA